MTKKTLIAAVLCLSCLFAATAKAALPNYSETIAPKGIDAAITATWKYADAKEQALLPVPAKGKLWNVAVTGAEAGKAEVALVNGETVLRVPLASVTGPVEVKAEWSIPGFYKLKTPKSGRGDLTNIKYSIVNTTGIGFETASAALSLPKGMRLFEVVDKKPNFSETDNVYTIKKNVKGKKGAPGLAAGAKIDMNVTMTPPSGSGSMMLWGFVAIVSAAALYFRRDLMPGRRNKENA